MPITPSVLTITEDTENINLTAEYISHMLLDRHFKIRKM